MKRDIVHAKHKRLPAHELISFHPDPDGSMTENETESLVLLADTPFPSSVRISSNDPIFEPKKTPEEDGIFPVLLQKGDDHLVSAHSKKISESS